MSEKKNPSYNLRSNFDSKSMFFQVTYMSNDQVFPFDVTYLAYQTVIGESHGSNPVIKHISEVNQLTVIVIHNIKNTIIVNHIRIRNPMKCPSKNILQPIS